jgi:hypothetical protein
VKHIDYPVYLALIAGLVLFNVLARRRGLSGRLTACCNIAWGLAAGAFMVLASEPPDWFHDFRVAYWHAGRLAFTDPVRMYDGGRQIAFVNLPLVALLFVPFRGLGEYPAGALFLALSVAVTAAAWWQLVRLGGLSGGGRWLLAGLFVLNGPYFHGLRHGNATIFVLPLLAAALGGLEGGRPLRSGVLLGLAVVLKPPLALLPAYYTLRRNWRVAAGCAAVVAAAGICSLLLFGTDVHRAWFQTSIGPFARQPLGAYNCQSVSSFLARFVADRECGEWWFPLSVGTGFKVVNLLTVLALGGGTLLVCTRRCGPGQDAAERLNFCLILCLALLTSPICWTHYFLLLLLPAALFLGGRLGTPPTRAWLAAGAVAFLAMSVPVRPWLVPNWWTCLLVAHPTAGALGLMALLAAARWRLDTAPASAPPWRLRLVGEPAPRRRLPRLRRSA